MNIKFDELLSEIGNVLQKKESLTNHVNIKRVEFNFSYIHAMSGET